MAGLHFAATTAAFLHAAEDFGRLLEGCGVRGRGRYQAELVFEEVITNLIRYGSTDDRAHAIDVEVACGADAVVLTFLDDGQPFDPRQQPAPARPASLLDAPIGGRGIALMRHAARDIAYTRTADGRNELIVTIPIR